MARPSWMWRLALRLLPRELRERHGEEMTRLLEEHLEGRGPLGRLSVHTRALIDAAGIAVTRRSSTERAGWTTVEGWARDFAYAARTLVRRPGFTTVAVITLALGTGVTTAVASLLYTVVLAPAPYEDPEEIVQIALVSEGRRNVMLPTAEARTLRQSTSEYLTLGLVRFQDVSVGGSGVAERVRGMIVTGPTLPMLGVEPLLGRLLNASDDVPGGPCVVALSHGLWIRRFGARPDVVETDASLDGRPCAVVAVMPEGFAFPAPYFAPGDLWLLAGPSGLDLNATDDGRLLAFGRMAAGADRATVGALVARVPVAVSGASRGRAAGGAEARFTAMRWADHSRDAARRRLLVLLAAAALVLVIACANLVTLQLGRSVDRRGELATRMALGASRARLVRLMVAETALLTLLGIAGGLVVATIGVELIVALRSFYIPRMEEVSIDGTSVVLCAALGAMAGLVGAGVPALGLAGGLPSGGLRGSVRSRTAGPRGRRFGRLLVTVETALAIVLLSGAVLLVRSYQALTQLEPGFRSSGILHARLTPPVLRYPDDASVATFYRALEERLAGVSGLREVAVAWVPPGVGAGAEQSFEVLGGEPAREDGPLTAWRSVGEGYFSVLDIPILRGAGFDEQRGTARAVIVNETFAERFLAGRDPLGEQLRLVEKEPDAGSPWTIVGVAADVHEKYVHSPVPPVVYVRWEDAPERSVVILAHTAGPPLAAAGSLRDAVAALDPGLPLYGVLDLAVMLESEYGLNRLSMTLLGLFACTALLLAVAGIYGVVAHVVGQRLREMGIRIALGALGADVLWLVVGDCGRFTLVGATLGVGLAALSADRLEALTPGWLGLDVRALAAAALVVTGVALVSAWVPARTAAGVDPADTLRQE